MVMIIFGRYAEKYQIIQVLLFRTCTESGKSELCLSRGDVFMAVKEKEIWKPIPKFDNYEVSNLGNVRNVHTGRIMTPNFKRRNGMVVGIRTNGSRYFREVSRLVAEAFLTDFDPTLYVSRKDDDIWNNRADNLYMSTRSDAGVKANNTKKERNTPSKRTQVRVVETGKIYKSISACVREIGLSRASLHQCIYNKQKNNKLHLHFELVDA